MGSKFPFPPIAIPAFLFPTQFPGFFHIIFLFPSELPLPIPIHSPSSFPKLTEHRLHSVSRSTYTKWAGEMRQHNKHVEIWTYSYKWYQMVTI